jgi:hypothetical protein
MSQSKIYVVEDFISPGYCNYLQNLIEESNLAFSYCKTTADGLGIALETTKESPQFVHSLVNDSQIKSNNFNAFDPIQYFFSAKTGVIDPSKLMRCKINLNYKDTSYRDNQHFRVHTDIKNDIKGITGIYYINDSDGDTLFFNETGTEVIFRFTPKKGTMVYFNNQIPHAGQPPKISDYRSVVNFNWME